jgi:hypothetical protein
VANDEEPAVSTAATEAGCADRAQLPFIKP